MDWDSVGIDWDGPVSLEDSDAVTVEELSDVLTISQKEQLDGLLSPLGCTTQQEMLAQYTIAKTFVNQAL